MSMIAMSLGLLPKLKPRKGMTNNSMDINASKQKDLTPLLGNAHASDEGVAFIEVVDPNQVPTHAPSPSSPTKFVAIPTLKTQIATLIAPILPIADNNVCAPH